jgi:hypothetical protein
MVLNLETLHANYDDFVAQWPLKAKYDIWWLCLNDPWMLDMLYNGLMDDP